MFITITSTSITSIITTITTYDYYLLLLLSPARNRQRGLALLTHLGTANLPAKILDFGGFDSRRILILRGVILRPIENFLEIMNQRILVGIILVGRLGVLITLSLSAPASQSCRTTSS